MFSDVINEFNDCYYWYINDLPTNMEESAVHSAIYSFVASVLLSGDVHAGIGCGALAAITSLIGALTTPFFRNFLAQHGQMTWQRQAVIITINVGIAYLVIKALTTSRINILAGIICSVGLNLIVNGLKNQYSSKNPNYILV